MTIYLQDLLLAVLVVGLAIVLLALLVSARRSYKQNQRLRKVAAREWVDAHKVKDEIDFMYWRASQEVKRRT